MAAPAPVTNGVLLKKTKAVAAETLAPGGNPWSSYMAEIYSSGRAPQPLGTVVPEEIEAKAKEKLKEYIGSFMYAGGSAGSNATYRANLKAFEKWGIIPRMLVNATHRSLETTIFSVKYSCPVFVAPIGVQAIFAEEAEFAPARAAKALNVPFILSTASSRTIEEVAEANGDGHRWYQLYWPRNNDVTVSLLSRAKKSGYSALVVTLDTMALGWRPHDIETAFLPFKHGVGAQIGLSDPVFMAKFGKEPKAGPAHHPKWPYRPAAIEDKIYKENDAEAKERAMLGLEWLKEANSGHYRDWEDLKFVRQTWEGPLVLKGIQSVIDAELAVDNGINGIIVSNHGGRQVDGAIPSLLALETIMKSEKVRAAQASGRLTILFDSGIRRGSDIFKAIALGAQGVLLGRPWLYGSILGGQAGVEQVLKHTLADLDSTLSLAGYTSLDQIRGNKDEVLMRIE